MKTDNLHLPFPPDCQQVELMASAIEGGAVASEGTDRYELMNQLVDGGFMTKHYCPAAMGVYQFTVSLAGLEVLQ